MSCSGRAVSLMILRLILPPLPLLRFLGCSFSIPSDSASQSTTQSRARLTRNERLCHEECQTPRLCAAARVSCLLRALAHGSYVRLHEMTLGKEPIFTVTMFIRPLLLTHGRQIAVARLKDVPAL